MQWASAWRIFRLLRLRSDVMVTGAFKGELDEVADAMALPAEELRRARARGAGPNGGGVALRAGSR